MVGSSSSTMMFLYTFSLLSELQKLIKDFFKNEVVHSFKKRVKLFNFFNEKNIQSFQNLKSKVAIWL